MAETFLNLQDQRHRADYDDGYDVSKAMALEHVHAADDALATLWRLHHERESGLVLLARLALGAVHIAVIRAP